MKGKDACACAFRGVLSIYVPSVWHLTTDQSRPRRIEAALLVFQGIKPVPLGGGSAEPESREATQASQ